MLLVMNFEVVDVVDEQPLDDVVDKQLQENVVDFN